LDRRSFGGGPDLTPLYIAEEDVNHFHSDGIALSIRQLEEDPLLETLDKVIPLVSRNKVHDWDLWSLLGQR